MSDKTTELYSLPESWEWTTLSKIGQIVSGGTPSTKKPEYWDGDIGWITPADLSGYTKKHIEKGRKSITQEGLENSSARLMPAGSVHFSSRAPIGYVAISKKPISTNQGFKSLIPAEGIFNEYVYYYLKSAKQLAEKYASGTTFKELSGKAFAKLPIPIPPLNEQRHIVAKIEELFSELDAGVAALEQARAQLKRYRQALLKAAFEGRLTEQWRQARADELEPAGALLARIRAEREARWQAQLAAWEREVAEWEAAGKPGKKPRKPRNPKELPPLSEEELAALPELPEGWGWVRLGNLNAEISDGPFGSNLKTSDYENAGVRVIRLENIGNLKFDDSKKSYVSVEKYETLKKHTVRGGDIIFSSFIGDELRVVVLPSFIDKAINKADCFLVRLLDKTLSNDFLAMYLSTRQVYGQLKHQIHGATRPRVNTTQLKHSIIPVCSAVEQSVIVDALEMQFTVIDYLDQTIEEALGRAAGLRQAILKKAFTGRLVPQDAEDEPASVLLERIRTGYTSH